MIAKPSKIRPLFMQCSIYFFILHLLLQFSQFTNTGAPAVTVHSWLGRQQPCLNGNTQW